ncbi:MAG TPA: FAD-dependent oxidoreductase [Burkholderiaceae bacterium]|nr:FAD-dependent oxidoreductase [Burkholderiaceae bacterium]
MKHEQSGPTAIVVGAGIVGLCTAYHLWKSGWQVNVIDRGEPGMGCSAGNAGSLSTGSVVPLGMPGILKQAPGMLIDSSGPLSVPPHYWLAAAPWLLRFVKASAPSRVAQIAMALKPLVAPSIACHQDIMADLGEPGLIQVAGQLHVYPDRQALAKDSGGWALRREHGVHVQELGPDDIRGLEPAVGAHYKLGYFLPDHGMVVNPLRQAQVIAAALAANGVEFTRDEVLHLSVDGRRVTGVACRQGVKQADHIVICAGAWSRTLLDQLGYRIPLETQRGYHVSLENSGIQLSRTVVAADRKIFAAPMETGLRLAGTVEFGGLDRQATARRAQLLLHYGKLIFPGLNPTAKADTWMGHRPCLPDSLPILGRAPAFEGLWLNFGHGHLGLTMSAVTGGLLAAAMNGSSATTDLSPYSIARFDSRDTRLSA